MGFFSSRPPPTGWCPSPTVPATLNAVQQVDGKDVPSYMCQAQSWWDAPRIGKGNHTWYGREPTWRLGGGSIPGMAISTWRWYHVEGWCQLVPAMATIPQVSVTRFPAIQPWLIPQVSVTRETLPFPPPTSAPGSPQKWLDGLIPGVRRDSWRWLHCQG